MQSFDSNYILHSILLTFILSPWSCKLMQMPGRLWPGPHHLWVPPPFSSLFLIELSHTQYGIYWKEKFHSFLQGTNGLNLHIGPSWSALHVLLCVLFPSTYNTAVIVSLYISASKIKCLEDRACTLVIHSFIHLAQVIECLLVSARPCATYRDNHSEQNRPHSVWWERQALEKQSQKQMCT